MSTRLRLRRADGAVYLDRWGIECRWGGVFLHRMDAPDPGVDLHNHPWVFYSFVLRGGYDEERTRSETAPLMARLAEVPGNSGLRGLPICRRWLSVKKMALTECHRITRLHRQPTWTLVVRGPKRQRWGFLLPTGWMYWLDYDQSIRAERRDMWAEITNVDDPRSTRERRPRSGADTA